MNDETINAATNAVTAIAGEIYKDIAQPSVRRVGGALDVVTKLVLSPIHILNWGIEQTHDWLQKKIRDRFSTTPDEYVAVPPNNIAYPALTHIVTSNDTPELRDLYAELLLKAMDKRTAGQVHPSYVFIIEQLSPQEALILVGLRTNHKDTIFTDEFSFATASSPGPRIEKQFADYCESIGVLHPDSSAVWLENLRRLGLLELHSFPQAEYHPSGANDYGTFEPSVETNEFRELYFTDFGRSFVDACRPPANAP